MNDYRKYVRLATLLVGTCLLMAGCHRGPKMAPTAPTIVQVANPVEREVTDHVDLTGTTAAVDSVEVRARVGGYLMKVDFPEGTIVQKGQVLFEIDPRPYQAQVDYAQGQVAGAEATLLRARADNARNRATAMRSPGSVSQQDLDQYQAAEDKAIADLAVARATLESNQLNLDFTKVTSPIDGRTSRYLVTIGNLIVQDNTLLTTVVSVNPIYAYVDVDEHTVLHVRQLIREGKAQSARESALPVSLGLADEKGFPHHGTINFVDNQVNVKTGTLRIRGVFDNKDEALSPGFFVRVRVPIGLPHKAILVSDRAIDTDQGQKIVYVVNDKNEVVYRPVKLGAMHDGLRVVEEGLKTDERVIVNGLQRVRPGMTVDPKPVDMPDQPKS